MSRILLGTSLFLLTLSAVFGVLNSHKVKSLHSDLESATAAREIAERGRTIQNKNSPPRESQNSGKNTNAAAEARLANAESELVKSQTERSALQSKLQAKETEITELKSRSDQTVSPPAAAAGPSITDLQSQLDETRKKLQSAENEKLALSEKVSAPQERVSSPERKQHSPTTGRPGLRGTVLAVNQAYNFVVLNLGGRQGVEANSEMLVLRKGTLIGKIRVSSVEPATAIGDIVSSTLARGVQVQTGDNVIYAGTNF